MASHWLADRARSFDASGIRKVFDLGAKLKNPINFSIGQPDFDVPAPARRAAIEAIESRKNGYSPTQGISALVEKLQSQIDREYGHADRKAFVASGTSGALMLALTMTVNPGDEVIVFDPCFMMYNALVAVLGGKLVTVDAYPTFQIDVNRVADAITPRTKAIIFNSPANPTGAVADEATVRALAQLAAERDVLLISDEVYRMYCYDRPFVSPAKFNPQTLVLDGFSKTYAMTGWRLGIAHGPSELIHEMLKLQQYTFVCAPQPFQWAGVAALDLDMSAQAAEYHRKRDVLLSGLAADYEIAKPGGAFYMFPKTPWGTDEEFVARAIEKYQLLIIPGSVFGQRATHFRISYAVDDATLARGIEALQKLAKDRR
jgi:aspartate/methionine/tyrosine aminotransferase